MPATKKTIPVHKLEETTDRGFYMERAGNDNKASADAILMGAHRDDHYIFLFQEEGQSRFMIDFSLYTLKAREVFFILPGQVHQVLEMPDTMGYFMALDATFVPALFRKVFEDPLLSRSAIQLTESKAKPVLECLRLLHKVYLEQPRSTYYEPILRGLVSSFTGMMAAAYSDLKTTRGAAGRTTLLTQQFRALVADRYKTMKSPCEYAIALNLSLSYLNEVVKASTGFPVSYWIQYEVMLEARRLLYHSDRSVKEIGYELGYEDPTYFSRLFRKTTQQTPGEFRKRTRE